MNIVINESDIVFADESSIPDITSDKARETFKTIPRFNFKYIPEN